MATKTFDLVSYEKQNRVAWITINNTEKMNALSAGVNNGLWDSYEEADKDDDVLVVVLTGAGGRAFCAGADLKERNGMTDAAWEEQHHLFEAMARAQLALPCPLIAEVNGIAMGGGTDVAIECAGVTLLTGDLAGLVRARRLSVSTMRNIRQNLAFAFLYNAAGVPIAAGVLYPVFGILLSPVIAAAAMALSSVSVIGNALRLRAVKL